MTKYLKVSPRGFKNEVIYLKVPENKVDEANTEFAGYEDNLEQGGYTSWTDDLAATRLGVAVDWADRHMVLV